MATSRGAPSVLLTCGWALGAPSGVARHLRELARHLALSGARVTVLCVSSAGYPRFPRPKLAPELEGRDAESELAEAGVDVVRVPPHPLHWALDARAVRRAVERVLLTRPLDAVLGFYHEAACLPRLLAPRGVRCGYLATWLSYRMALAGAGGGVRAQLRRALQRRLVVEPYRAADVLFASSAFTRSELVDVVGCDPARIRVAPLGVREAFHLVPRVRARRVERILFFGRLVREKGIGDALEALARAARAGRDFTLRVVGSGDAAHVRGLAREHGLAQRVELVAHVDDERLADELARAHLALLPSHSESFGLALAEAQAAGLAVVAYAAGAVPEVVADGESGWLAPLHDVDALAQALEHALADPDECFRRGLAGRERVAHLFRWEHTARAVLDGLACPGAGGAGEAGARAA